MNFISRLHNNNTTTTTYNIIEKSVENTFIISLNFEENIEELSLKFSTIPFTEEQIALMFTKTF